MFQFDWNNKKLNRELKIDVKSSFNVDLIDKIQFSFWAEHCLECSAPKCFKTCDYYEKRCDGRCKRTKNGQQPFYCEASIAETGSHFTFLPWAKIETYVYNHFQNIDEYKKRTLNYKKRVDRYNSLGIFNIKRVFNNLSYYKITRSKERTNAFTNADVFLFEIVSESNYEYKMIIEAADIDWKVISRESVLIKPGFNSFLIDYKKIAPSSSNVVRFYPENNLTPTISIINAEFVKTKMVPSKKVKCVAWDLDNTIWSGILAETDSFADLHLRDGVLDTIIELDKRGIIQTIVSKNEHDIAIKALDYFGILDYFLYPAINWGQKSSNISKIAQELNINVDSFLLVDDSSFEREEVSQNLPQVRVYNEKTNILLLPECDVPITVDAMHRREMYQTEAKRKKIQAEFGDNYFDFLKSCNIEVEIRPLTTEDEINRCYELINRTNQLNISGNRYEKIVFLEMIKKDCHILFNCKDKFGEYGVVGYICFEVDDSCIIIKEFAVSCRVAQKHIERAVISWIANTYGKSVRINYVKTQKNKPILDCLLDAGFSYDDSGLFADYSSLRKDEGIILISAKLI